MTAIPVPRVVSNLARRPIGEGPAGIVVLFAGFATGGFLVARGAFLEAALILLISLLGWRLRHRLVEGLRRERRAQEEVVLQARLLDAVGEAVVGCSAEGEIVTWNRTAERMLGWRRAEAVGRPMKAVLPAVDPCTAAAPGSRELTLRHRDGRGIDVRVSSAPLDFRAGSAAGLVLVLVDLTLQKASEREQRVLAEVGAVLAAGLGAEATLMEAARRALPALGEVCLVDIVEDGTLRRLDALHASRRSAAVAGVAHAIAGGEPAWPDPIRRRALAGEALIIPPPTGFGVGGFGVGGTAVGGMGAGDVNAGLTAAAASLLASYGCQGLLVAPLRVRGRTLAVLSFLAGSDRAPYDRDDLELARELAERVAVAVDNARLMEETLIAGRSKADFLAVMSHELRTPLTAIMGYADLLRSGLPEPLSPKGETYVERMRTAAWHLLRIIEQILTYARLDVGREEADPGRVSLAEFVRETAALMEPVAAEKGVAFTGKAPEEDVTLVTDATKLRQILLNLLSNAVKFTEGGVVALSAFLEGDTAVFEVRDTGVGIAPEHLERIFDPFWQVDQSSARRAGGTGIGLSVAQRLARLLGGGISAASNPGEGTTFTLRIPAEWRAPAQGEVRPACAVSSSRIRPAARVTR